MPYAFAYQYSFGHVLKERTRMNFIRAVKLVFSGRAMGSEYWWFMCFAIIMNIILALIDVPLFGTNPETGNTMQIFTPVFQLAIMVPPLAVGWRRLHDTGR